MSITSKVKIIIDGNDTINEKRKITLQISNEYGYVKNAKVMIKEKGSRNNVFFLDLRFLYSTPDKYSFFETDEFCLPSAGEYFYQVILVLNDTQYYIFADSNGNPVLINDEEFFEKDFEELMIL